MSGYVHPDAVSVMEEGYLERIAKLRKQRNAAQAKANRFRAALGEIAGMDDCHCEPDAAGRREPCPYCTARGALR